jgi:ribosome-associated protein
LLLKRQATILIGKETNSDARKLCLDQFLKLSSIAGTGGHAKFMIQNGEVLVNGEIELRRRRKLVVGDVVDVGGEKYLVTNAVFTE